MNTDMLVGQTGSIKSQFFVKKKANKVKVVPKREVVIKLPHFPKYTYDFI